tara:strand:- start:55 stop:1239 length:1185 start_codon:yes stop_codon:yes gene_type:complete
MGGCAKHMMHPYDNLDMTFEQLADLICKVGSASVKACEKVDGINIHWSVAEDNMPRFAVNIGQLKSGGLSYDELKEFFDNHPAQTQFLAGAYEIQSRTKKLFGGIPWPMKKNLSQWVNTEIISKAHPQCLEYEFDCLVFHDLVEYSEELRKCVSVAVQHDWAWSSFVISHVGCEFFDWPTYHKLDVTLQPNFRAIQNYLAKLHKIMDFWNLNHQDTLRNYYAKITRKELSQWLPRAAAEAVVENVWFSGKNKIRFIKKELCDWAPIERFNRISLSKHRAGYQGECKRELAYFFDSFGAELIQDTKSNLIKDTKSQKNILKSKMEKSMQAMENAKEEYPVEYAKASEQWDRFVRLKVSPPVMEGIVFELYHGKYKLTGSFPSMNRVAGASRYSLR